ncbi:MAG: dihydroneopterin aldolase [Microbacteriaceae bacterium]|nr:dihydroneopterin aldolase [Microbacteriaceae bacterium]MDR9443952.1 dihydroneopterin aldolase [Microbacteriaceae bacterium]
MNQIIRLSGIEAIGFHGVLESERENGQTFIVDCELEVDTSQSVVTDNIEHAVDYSKVAELIAQQIQTEPVNLIEVLADRMAAEILRQFLLVKSVEITLHKPQAPIAVDFKDVSTTVIRTTEKW